MAPSKLGAFCCMLGVQLHGAVALEKDRGDAVALVQANARVHEELHQVPTAAYTFEKYGLGETVEGKQKDGTWVPVTIVSRGDGNVWNVHVSDDFPGYDLPNVPSSLLRRSLAPGQADFLVDNSKLHHKGLGLKYRHSKDLNDRSEEYVAWGALVVGSDEGDGWVKAASGYLPTNFRGAPVLVRVERQGELIMSDRLRQFLAEQEEKKKKAAQPAEVYAPGEQPEFKTKSGDWKPCRILGLGSHADTYHVVVFHGPYKVNAVSNVPASHLRRTGPPPHVPREGEAPQCRKVGCLTLRVHSEKAGEQKIEVAKSSKMDMMMRMVCNRQKIDWETCQARAHFAHNGEEISPFTHVSMSGLEDDDVVTMEMRVPGASRLDALVEDEI
mmetsp:Transcript_95409/g.265129  ORF Transcript_95409/g.265129 Transcript_95409/m.265129 type:complete len:384 (+) Transcript_95409:83-1234(+)